MGNTGACGLFDENRRGQDQFWIDGLTEKENLTIKELYKKMDISGNWYHFILENIVQKCSHNFTLFVFRFGCFEQGFSVGEKGTHEPHVYE